MTTERQATDGLDGGDAPEALARAAAPAELLRYVEDARELVPGNAVKMLHNGVETFPAWLDAIERARERVSLEMYIFNDDAIGRKFADALIRAAGRGVHVRVMYDFVGCRDTPAAFFQKLRAGGVHTIAYHKYRFWRPRFWTLVRRNHRKTLVCDGRVAFTGGLNIANDWVCLADGGGDWHDAVIQVEGPAVPVLEGVFLRTWNRRARKRARLDPTALARPAPAGDTRLVVVSNTELRERFAIRRAALAAMRASVRRIYLANPYFVPDRGILRALQAAARRGVDVRLLVPLRSDSRLLDIAARATFGALLKGGVRIWRSQAVIHTKVLAIDEGFVSIGSYNFDHRSLAYNLEVVVNVLDVAYNATAVAMLADDIATSTELTLETFEQRPPLERVLERLAHGLRHWL
jgi:cardiolipin synthase